MKRPWLVLVPILFVVAVAGLAMWLRSRPGGDAGNSCQPGQAADYFPYQLGTQASYTGAGNEYASYTVNVVGQSGTLVEWRRASGGTTLAEVFQVTQNQVVLRYREGEVYDNTPRINQPPNQSEPILHGPVAVGSSWAGGNGSTYTITSVNDTVTALNNQTISCTLVVEEQSANSLIRRWYHQQYGLVLSVFDPNGTPVESRLATFSP